MTLSIDLPLRLVNASNRREHWAARAKRAKTQRVAARLAVWGPWGRYSFDNLGDVTMLDRGLVVNIIRIAPRPLDDDGAVTSAKNVRDGIADALGLAADNDPRVTWVVAQERGKPRTYGVRIEISERAQCCPMCGK